MLVGKAPIIASVKELTLQNLAELQLAGDIASLGSGFLTSAELKYLSKLFITLNDPNIEILLALIAEMTCLRSLTLKILRPLQLKDIL